MLIYKLRLQSHQKRRLLEQREMAKKIVQLISEVNFAKVRYVRKEQEKIESKERIIKNKLKPKGHLLLEKGQ